MSNYKYAIKKLPIKSWIKYWLWLNRSGGGKYKFALSDIKEGTNFYLENTIKRKFNIFEVYGKTTQNGTPTPENPIPIINLTGNINEKIQNKNLADISQIQIGKSWDNSFNTSQATIMFIPIKENEKYSLASSFTNSHITRIRAVLNDGEHSIAGNTYNDNATFTNTNYKYVSIEILADTTFTVEMLEGVKILFCEGIVTIDDYQSHSEQNISFPLAQGQVLAQGDYLADDGIHHVRGKVALDGTENWNYNSSNNVFIIANFINYKIGAYTPMSTHYIGQTNVTEYRDVNDKSITCLNNSTNNRTIIKDTMFTSSNDFKNYLAEQYANGTPVEVEYELAEEVIEPFTEEQQEAYNKIKELYTYNEITNIDGNANLKIKYWERVER